MITSERKVQQGDFESLKSPFAKRIKQTADNLSLTGERLVLLALFMIVTGGWLIPLTIATGNFAIDLILYIFFIVVVIIQLFIAGGSLCGRSNRINCLIRSLSVTGSVPDEIADNNEETMDVLLDNTKQSLKTSDNKADLRPLIDDYKAWQQLERETEDLSCRVKYGNQSYICACLIACLVLGYFDYRYVFVILPVISMGTLIIDAEYRPRLDVPRWAYNLVVGVLTLLYLTGMEILIFIFVNENVLLGRSLAPLLFTMVTGILLLLTHWRFTCAAMELRVRCLRKEINHWKNRLITLQIL